MSLFVNYVRDSVRDSPVNVAVARVLLSVLLIWKTLSYQWAAIGTWPVTLWGSYTFLHPPPVEALLPLEQWVLAFVLVLFALGYRTRWTSVVGAFLVAHMAAVRWSLNYSGGTEMYFVMSHFLLVFGLFREQDVVSVDTLRRTADETLTSLNDHLQSPTDRTHRADALKWCLVVFAILYFGSAVGKVVGGPLPEWVAAENIARYTLHRNVMLRVDRPFGNLLLQEPLLLWGAAVGTVVLEGGFLVAVLLGVSITPFVVGLVGMHVVIALGIGPFFFDNIVLFALFVPWDRVYERAAFDRAVDVVYDEHCYFCARSLYLFEVLDVNDTVTFYSQYTAPDAYEERTDVAFESAMYAFADGETYRGYEAFRELLRQFTVFFPLVWFMGRRPVEIIGTRVYQYVADNRDRYFTCAVEAE